MQERRRRRQQLCGPVLAFNCVAQLVALPPRLVEFVVVVEQLQVLRGDVDLLTGGELNVKLAQRNIIVAHGADRAVE